MAIINGDAGDNKLEGTSGDDTINGFGGRDTIIGGAGNDLINGGEGQDTIYFDDNSGYDTVDGGTGGDELGYGYASFDGDFLNGKDLTKGATVNVTSPGNGTIAWNGGGIEFTGVEQISTGSGNDHFDASGLTNGMTQAQMDEQFFGVGFYGGAGDDFIRGSDLRDTLDGGAGNDTIYAGGGSDLIQSSSGDDLVYGEGGDDGIRWGMDEGGSGHDTYFGGETDEESGDALNFWGPDGYRITLDGAESGNAIYGTDGKSTLQFAEFERLIGGEGADYFDGSNATIEGGIGTRFSAGAGDDTIIGTSGNDELRGDNGADHLIGGRGDDWIYVNGNRYGDPTQPDVQVDTVYFGNGDGHDTLVGFNAPVQGPDGTWSSIDKIELNGYFENGVLRHPGMTNPDGSPISISDVQVLDDGNGNAVLVFPGGESLTFLGVSPEELALPGQLHALGIPCFVRGTKIKCATGDIAVEDLRPGQLVVTRDHGLQPIRWVGGRKLHAAELRLMPKLRPIRICAGALGQGLPVEDLFVSPEHRVLVRSSIARRMFGAAEVLVAARQLLGLEGIETVDTSEVEYFHILFDQHEILLSNGAETESLYTGVEAMKSVGAAAREEIFTLFPELREDGPSEPARPFVEGRQARSMTQRHLDKQHPLLDRAN